MNLAESKSHQGKHLTGLAHLAFPAPEQCLESSYMFTEQMKESRAPGQEAEPSQPSVAHRGLILQCRPPKTHISHPVKFIPFLSLFMPLFNLFPTLSPTASSKSGLGTPWSEAESGLPSAFVIIFETVS